MEKPVKLSKAKMILKLLPKSAAISFQSLPFSPGRDIKTHCNKGIGFSGPIVSIIPAEARRKSGMDTQEPSSPKVSCIGQIKHKKKMAKQKRQHQKRSGEKQHVDPLPTKKDYARSLTSAFQERSSSAIGKIFHGRRSDASADSSRLREDAPSLGQMKRFASGRETLSDFNYWTTTAQVVPHARKYCLDDDDDEEDEYEDHEIIIPFSAPMLTNIGGHGSTTLPLEPRKEINLWKRRTMAQPKPLQLNAMIR